MTDPVVVKVGGSLYDLPDLGPRLRAWLVTLDTRRVLLVPGGGAAADCVRQLDQLHRLGQEKAHWLALRALQLNASFLATLLPGSIVVEQPSECEACWQRGEVPILEMYAFAVADEGTPGCLPHTWKVTSDSLAVRVAHVSGAKRLVLLKSVDLDIGCSGDWVRLADTGQVDEYFFSAVKAAGPGLTVQVVNLRAWLP